MIAFRKKVSGAKLNRNYKNKIQKMSSVLVLRQYDVFKQNIYLTARRLDSFSGRTIYGYGAALMLPVLEYYLNRLSRLKYIIDDDRLKKDLFYLNLTAQIKLPDQIEDIESSIVLVTAMNSLQTFRAVMQKLFQLHAEKIIVPVNLV